MRGLRQRALAEPVRAPGLAGTAALHLLVVATFVLGGGLRGHPRLPQVYRVTLIAPLGPAVAATAAPTPAAPAAAAPRARPAPPAAKAAPRSREPAVALERPRQSRTPAAPPPGRTKAPPRPQPAAAPATPAPAPAPATSPAGSPGGTDATTIRTEGVEFPFPGYLHNLVAQVYRQWRPPPSNALLEAEVFFLVHRDGSVSGLEFIRRSGSFAFDLEAQGAIEAAARADAFGPLPEGYGPDLLPVSFFFNPRAPQ
jgi:protein TonB